MKAACAIAGVLLWLTAPAWADLIIRSAAELDAMTDAQLAEQAMQACTAVSSCKKQPTRTDLDCRSAGPYLDTIGVVARKHHSGQMPVWMEGFRAAAKASFPDACNRYTRALAGGALKNFPTPRSALRK